MSNPSTPQRTTGWTWLVVVICCLISLALKIHLRYGLGYIFFGDAQTGLPRSDASSWYLHAINLLEGRGIGDIINQFVYRNFVPPGHPFILATLAVWLGPDPIRLGWAIALLTSLLPAFMFLWGREMWGPRTALWMAGLVAIHPPYSHVGFSMMAEPTSVLTMAFTFYIGARAVRTARINDTVLAGLTFGLAGLVRPAVLAFLWGGLVMMALRPQLTGRQRAVRVSIWLLVALLPLGLWQVRNHRVHGVWSTVYSSISARHIWTGQHPEYRPYFYSRGSMHETLWSDPHVSEINYIRRMQDEARVWIREDRLRFVLNSIWRLNDLVEEFRIRNVTIRYDQNGWRDFYLRFLIVFALLGVVTALRTKVRHEEPNKNIEISGKLWTVGLAVGLLVSIWGAGVYGATTRYRWPLELAWIPFAALFMRSLLSVSRMHLYALRHERHHVHPMAGRSKKIGYIAGIALLIPFLYSTTVLLHRQHAPARPEERVPVLSTEDLRSWIEEAGLKAQWASQDAQWIHYDDVFAEQAENFGAVRDLNGSWVAWWGILRIVNNRNDQLQSADFIVEAHAGTLGKARLPITAHPHADLTGPWQDGQVVTILGQLTFEDRPLSVPVIQVHAIKPARL